MKPLPIPKLEETINRQIQRALARAGSAGKAAQILGIHKNTVLRRVKKFNLKEKL